MNSNINIQISKDQILNTIYPSISQSVNDLLKNEILDYYTTMTIKEKKQKLSYYREKFKNILNGFKENKESINYYFNAYEEILQFRKFLLGKLGDINYTFSWRIKQKGKNGNVIIRTVTIDSEKFVDLLKDKQGNIIGLQKSGDNLRFNGTIIQKLKAQLKKIQKEGINININQNCSSFSIENEIVGTKQDFVDGKLFKSKIEALQRNETRTKDYQFIIKLTKDISKKEQANVFKFDVTEVRNSPESSSIFSAIGKYFADEMITKKELAQKNNIDKDPSYPNAGNLTEMYIVAKARLNEGHNTFYNPDRRPVAGKDLFEIYNEIKANTEPFYSGGDYLMNQIKSFLGSNPSLTSYSTIEKTVKSFYEALDVENFDKMKQDLSKLLLQKPSTSKILSEEQKIMSQNISESFILFFSDLV